MYQNTNILNILAILSFLAITPVIADGWPKRGLAANEDVPIWQVCTYAIPILLLFPPSERLLFAEVVYRDSEQPRGFFSGVYLRN